MFPWPPLHPPRNQAAPPTPFERRRRSAWRWLWQGPLWALGVVLLLLVAAIVTIRLPRVQTWATGYLSALAYEKTGFDVRFGRVDLNFYDKISLDSIVAFDKEGNRMIEIPRASIDFALSRLLTREVTLDYIHIERGHVRIITSKKTDKVNINDFVDGLTHWLSPDTARSVNPPNFYITEATVSRFQLTIFDERKDSIRDGFDYRHMHFDGITGLVHNFRARADTVELGIEGLKARSVHDNWPIHKLETFFRTTRQRMTFLPLQAWIGNSYIADSLTFSYGKQADMADFVEKVTIRANLKQARIDYRDLAVINHTLRGVRDSVRVTGKLQGRVPDLALGGFTARFGKASQLKGSLSMKGLPTIMQTQMDIRLSEGYLLPQDLATYIPAIAMPYLERAGPSDIEGRLTGLPKDLRFKGGLYTQHGVLLPDFALTYDTPEQSRYSGTFTAQNLDVGHILDQSATMGRLTGKGSIAGRGFTLASAKLEVKAAFERIGLGGYPFKRVVTDATLARRVFDGYLRVEDSNLIAEANGLADLAQRRMVFDIDLNVRRARLKALGLANRQANITGKAIIKGSGSTADDAEGELRLLDAAVEVEGRRLALDTLLLDTRREPGGRRISLASDFVSGTIDGDFSFATIGRDMEASLNDYGRLFRNKRALANKTAVYSKRPYNLQARLNLRDVSPVIALYEPRLKVARNATLEVDLQKTTNLLAQVNAKADYLALDETVIDGPRLDLISSKVLDEPNVLASVTVFSPSQRLGKLITKDLQIDGVWDKEGLRFTSGIHQSNDSNYVELAGGLDFEPAQVVTRLSEARIRLFDSVWTVSPLNRLTFDGRKLVVDSLAFGSGEQRVAFDGIIGPAQTDTLHVGLDSLSLSLLNALVEAPFKGRAQARLSAIALLTQARYRGQIEVPNLRYADVPLGDLSARVAPDFGSASLLIDGRLTRGGKRVLGIDGRLNATPQGTAFDLGADMQDMPIKVLEPLFKGLASNWAGTATGRLHLGGTPAVPVLTGAGLITDGAITVDYLRTRYTFSDSVRLGETYISATGATLYDQAGNAAKLRRAVVRHEGFENFSFDIQGDLERFQVLGTTYKDSKLYYGSAYATGDVSIRGPVGDIVIAANLKTDAGTRLYLPLSDALAATTSTQSFITFVGKQQQAQQAVTDSVKDALSRVNLSGIRLLFNVEVTPQAYGEIIFDRQTGDMVRVYGNGRLKLGVDTRGDFTMFGRYNITSGQYRFTFSNLINKDFQILDGSSITWNGDPAEGTLDIQAKYAQTVPFSPLLIGQASGGGSTGLAQDSIAATRRYPVNVLLSIQGRMLQPQITPSIDVPPEYPSSLARYVTALQSLVSTNEQEMNKQVFSLLLLRSLSPIGVNTYGSGVAASATGGNLSELLSAQLSNWLSEVSQNLEVGVGFNGFSQQALDNFQLRVSATFLEGRLRITRNGAFTNNASQATTASVAGDWTLEYNLTQDGKLRAKLFHRTNQTLTGSGIGLGSQYATTSQGASLMHTQSFSSLRELLPWLYGEKRKDVAPPPQVQPPTPAQPGEKQLRAGVTDVSVKN